MFTLRQIKAVQHITINIKYESAKLSALSTRVPKCLSTPTLSTQVRKCLSVLSARVPECLKRPSRALRVPKCPLSAFQEPSKCSKGL